MLNRLLGENKKVFPRDLVFIPITGIKNVFDKYLVLTETQIYHVNIINCYIKTCLLQNKHMSVEIDKLVAQGNITRVLEQCIQENQLWLGMLLAKIAQETEFSPEFMNVHSNLIKMTKGDTTEVQPILPSHPPRPQEVVQHRGPSTSIDLPSLYGGDSKKYTRVMMLCNWCDSRTLCNLWNKMSQGNYTWNNIRIVWDEPCDYYVVVNCPPIGFVPDPKKTIYFSMEPKMWQNVKMWGEWADPKPQEFFFCGKHQLVYNNNEWHLSKTYKELLSEPVIKEPEVAGILSTVLSDKYKDPGHVKRIDFIKFLDNKGIVPVHVFGGNRYKWKQYKGSPPPHCKDEAMFPYKYVFNAENHSYRNYYTEKLIDGILAECLVFYWGCPNIKDFIDERAYVQLDLIDFNKDMNTIKQAIAENWWESRLPHIQEAKRKILNERQFFPRLERIIAGTETTRKS
jgi:hypothetical protein